MTDRSFCFSIELDNKFFLIGGQVFYGNDKQPFIELFNFSRRKSHSKCFFAVGVDSPVVRQHSKEARVYLAVLSTNYLAVVMHLNSTCIFDCEFVNSRSVHHGRIKFNSF